MSACDICPGADETFSKLCEECTNEQSEDHTRVIAERDAALARVAELEAQLATRAERKRLTGCDGKKSYDNLKHAADAIIALRKQGHSTRLTAYNCGFCKRFHLGGKRAP